MGKIALRDHNGYTLIELLAVMAIVAILAGIVSVSAAGTDQSSSDTQTKQDATSVESAVASFFGNQRGTETSNSKVVEIFNQRDIKQVTTNKWPEKFITDAYPQVFPEGIQSNIGTIVFLDKFGELSDLRVRRLLQRFNAVDFDALSDGGFLTTVPKNASETSKRFANYLWLLEKSTASSSSGDVSSRNVAVFKLDSIQTFGDSEVVDLFYQRLYGGEFVDAIPVASSQTVVIDEDTPTNITLVGTDLDTCELFFAVEEDTIHGILSPIINHECVSGEPNTDSGSVIYDPDLNFNGEDSFTYSVIDGNGDDIATVTVTITVVNDAPLTGPAVLEDVEVDENAPDTLIDLTAAFSDVDGDILTYIVTANSKLLLVGATVEGPPEDAFLRLQYLPDQFGTAEITVRASDADAFVESTFTVTVNDSPQYSAYVTVLSQNTGEEGYAAVVDTSLDQVVATIQLPGSINTFNTATLHAGDIVFIGLGYASGSKIYEIDPTTFTLARTLEIDRINVFQLLLDPEDLNKLIVFGRLSGVTILDLTTLVETTIVNSSDTRAIAIRPGTRDLYVGTWSTGVFVYDLVTGVQKHHFSRGIHNPETTGTSHVEFLDANTLIVGGYGVTKYDVTPLDGGALDPTVLQTTGRVGDSNWGYDYELTGDKSIILNPGWTRIRTRKVADILDEDFQDQLGNFYYGSAAAGPDGSLLMVFGDLRDSGTHGVGTLDIINQSDFSIRKTIVFGDTNFLSVRGQPYGPNSVNDAPLDSHTIITFDDVLTLPDEISSYTESGLTMTMTDSFNSHSHTAVADTLDSDGAIMIHTGTDGAENAEFDIGGTAFDLVRFDLAPTTVSFGTNTFTSSSGATITVTTPGTVVLSDAWAGITSFTWNISGSPAQAVIDNLVISLP